MITPVSTRPRSTARKATALALAAVFSLATVAAEARPGSSSGGFGSRGGRTYSAPAPTPTSPGARPMERSATQPGPTMNQPGMAGAAQAGQRRGFGFGGGFFAGLLGAGLLGALFGHGFFGGLGGLMSMLGFLLQVGLVVALAVLAFRFFRRRQGEPAFAGPSFRGPTGGPEPRGPVPGGGLGAGFGGQPAPVQIGPADYQAFERTLYAVQAAYSAEDLGALRRLATPEMVGYLGDEIQANAARGVVNRIENVKLLQGDLSEAWREGPTEYATVAMRFALTDTTVERGSGRVVNTGPSEATEFWTFRRDGGDWVLSAIQQGR